MLDSMVRQTTDTLNNTINQTLLSRNYGVNPVMRTYQEILKRSTIETVTGLKTHDRAVKDAIYQQLDKGIEVMRDKSGRAWSLEGYTRMVLTTTSNRTYNELRTKRMQEFGQVLCLMSSHPNSREACAYIQGKVVNIVPTNDPNYNDKYDSIYNHGYGEPAGTLGINCRHKLFPFTPGVNVNNMTQYNPKEAIRNGNLRQKQRYYERSIRDAKKRLKIAEELEDEQMITRTKTLISARQKKLREYIKETNKMYGKKYDILTRDYAREQVVNKNHDSKEIEILKKRKTINVEKQNKHLKGTKEYNRYREKLSKREYEQSYITVDIDTLDNLVRKNLNPRKLMRQYQYVDVGIEIGHYRNKDVDELTTRVKVMQSKTGYHAVPAKPKEMLPNEN